MIAARLATPANPAFIARAAVRLAGSTDPVAIAEALGFVVAWGEPWRCLWARGAQLGRVLYVSLDVTDESEVEDVIRSMVALALVDEWSVATADPFGLAREVAEALADAREAVALATVAPAGKKKPTETLSDSFSDAAAREAEKLRAINRAPAQIGGAS